MKKRKVKYERGNIVIIVISTIIIILVVMLTLLTQYLEDISIQYRLIVYLVPIVTLLTYIIRSKSIKLRVLRNYLTRYIYFYSHHKSKKNLDKPSKLFKTTKIERIVYAYYKESIEYKKLSKEQVKAIDKILKCIEGNFNIAFWLFGEKTSGKNTVIYNVLNNLIMNTKYNIYYQKYNNRIEYYNIRDGSFDLEYFIRKISNPSYNDTLCIIDNIDSLSYSEFNIFYSMFLVPMKLEQLNFKAVLLSRPLEKINYDSHLLNDYFYDLIRDNFSAYLTLINKDEKKFTKIKDDLSINKRTCNYLLIFLGVYRIEFDYKIFRKLFKICEKYGKCNIKPRRFFKENKESGLIEYSLISNRYKVDSDIITNVYKEYEKDIHDSVTMLKCFFALITEMNLAFFFEWDNYLSILSLVHEYKNTVFDTSLKKGNLKTMYYQLTNFVSSNRLSDKLFSKEIGILSDRLGDLDTSLKYLTDYYSQFSKDTLEYNKGKYYLIQVQHGYHNKHVFPKIDRTTTKDQFLIFSDLYWRNHINLHNGIFDLDSYYDDFLTVSKSINYDHVQDYEVLHVLRRIYSDFFRLYYLQGCNDNEFLFKLQKELTNNLNCMLSKQLDEFETYMMKFELCYFIHFTLIFRINFDKNLEYYQEYMSYLFDKFAITYEKPNDDNLFYFINMLTILYNQVRDKFILVGDRLYNTIEKRLFMVYLMNEHPDYRSINRKIESQIELLKSKKDNTLAIGESLANLQSYLIKSRMSEYLDNDLLLNSPDLLTDIANDINELLSSTKIIYKKIGDKYGIFRTEFLDYVKKILIDKNQKDVINDIHFNLMHTSQSFNYHKEEMILKKINQIKGVRIEFIRKIIKFYPITVA